MDVFKVRNISAGYHNKKIINDVSLVINSGEMVGIIGPNGTGKTTLFRCLTKALNLSCGAIVYKDQDLAKISFREFSQSVAVVPQMFEFPFSFTIEELVLMGRYPHLGRFQAVSDKDYKIVEEALDLTQLKDLRHRRISELSGGEKQMAVLAQGFAQDPEVLFLDEPTAHLDIAHQIRILDILKTLNKSSKITVILVLHDLNLASEYCDRLVLFDQGKVFSSGTPEEIITYQNIEKVYKTLVVVKENPISKKPFVILVSGKTST